jgi:hypothetical protein
MNEIRKEALKETIKVVVGLTIVSLLVPAVIFTVPLPILGTAIAFGALCFAIKMIYDMKLNQAEYRATLKQMVDKN